MGRSGARASLLSTLLWVERNSVVRVRSSGGAGVWASGRACARGRQLAGVLVVAGGGPCVWTHGSGDGLLLVGAVDAKGVCVRGVYGGHLSLFDMRVLGSFEFLRLLPRKYYLNATSSSVVEGLSVSLTEGN